MSTHAAAMWTAAAWGFANQPAFVVSRIRSVLAVAGPAATIEVNGVAVESGVVSAPLALDLAQISLHERAPSPSLCSHSASFDLGITPGSTGVREKPL